MSNLQLTRKAVVKFFYYTEISLRLPTITSKMEHACLTNALSFISICSVARIAKTEPYCLFVRSYAALSRFRNNVSRLIKRIVDRF